ncbi:MAG: hypothetical protein ACFFE2_09810 [Candidatus Thorarchaeota archaeon]
METPDYEDTIGEKPARVKLLDNDQYTLMNTHIEIIRALCCKYLTVKEIHRHFLVSPEKPSYSRALKTLYRDLDILEKSELVKVVGYRKYKGSRQTEKLYSCTAEVFFPQESVVTSKWWLSKTGQEYLTQLSQLIIEFFHVTGTEQSQIKKLLERFFELWDKTVRQLFRRSEESEKLTAILSGMDISWMDDTTRFIGMMGAFFTDSSLFGDLIEIIDSDINAR